MFDSRHTSTEPNDTLFNPGSTSDADPGFAAPLPTLARCWPRPDCLPTRSGKFSPPEPTPERTAE